jgi:hypothetical protein
MFNFIAGTIFGIIVATVGVPTVAQVFNGPVQMIQKFALDQAVNQQKSTQP